MILTVRGTTSMLTSCWACTTWNFKGYYSNYSDKAFLIGIDFQNTA